MMRVHSRAGMAFRDVIALIMLLAILGGITLPLISTSLWVGHADLEILIQVTDQDSSEIKDALVKLVESSESPQRSGEPLKLRTDSHGRASHVFPTVTATGATNVFGQESNYNANVPWWEVSVTKEGYLPLAPKMLPIIQRETGARVVHVGKQKARLVIPLRLQAVP